ncbi:hypothetical protein [Oceaniglobus trochenteri]|uniref:hypothetical protein n=1 Tax=Oceaniglobus trochenteri TaxID=2763260 RepID=UPI001CFFEC11|nr:hypothetical protein [Oceaniglobus trochenteri]
MANMHDCLQRAVDAGRLDKVRAREAGNRFDQLVARYETTMPRHQAEARAAADLKEATSAAATRRHHAVINQLQSMRRIDGLIRGAKDPALALRQLIEHSEGSGFAGESVSSLNKAMVKDINAGMRRVLERHGQTIAGNTRNRAQFENIVRELHGDDTGDVMAREMAEAVREVQDKYRRMFNAHGGDIGKIGDYGLPHAHDVNALRKAGFDAWFAEVSGRLDWSRMIDKSTGKPFADGGPVPVARQREFLQDIYQGIVTRGWDQNQPSMAMGGKALYNQRAEPRILHFTSGKDWLEYNKAFGSSDPFSAMIGGLHGLARDVAQMRVLGPNPRMGLEFAIQTATKIAETSGDAKLADKVKSSAALAKTMLAHVDGSNNVADKQFWGSFFGGVRQTLTSIQLGSALLSSTTDLATIKAASSIVGMNGNNVLSRSVQLMASKATRETAARMGYVAESLADMGATAARFTGEQFAPEVTRRLSGFTMRASGLSFWTDMHKVSFQMEFAGFMADNAARSFDKIDAPLRKLFLERGITAEDWDALRDPAALFRAPNGATFLSPIHWRNAQTRMSPAEADGLSLRVQMMMEEQLELAMPTASIEGTARTQRDTKPGTFSGEFLRSFGMYKSFALSLTLGQIRRFNSLPTPMEKATYAIKMAAGLMVMGALAVQLKEVAKGRDPRPMDEGKFWMAALFQSGGLGIFGDFFSSETSRAGGGLAETLAGPVAGVAGDVIRIGASNVTRAVEGKDTLFGRDLANAVRYNTPVASSLWPTRLAFDRLVADQLQLLLDPDAERLMRRQEARRAKEYGTQTYWPRGALSPARLPDISNIAGNR